MKGSFPPRRHSQMEPGRLSSSSFQLPPSWWLATTTSQQPPVFCCQPQFPNTSLPTSTYYWPLPYPLMGEAPCKHLCGQKKNLLGKIRYKSYIIINQSQKSKFFLPLPLGGVFLVENLLLVNLSSLQYYGRPMLIKTNCQLALSKLEESESILMVLEKVKCFDVYKNVKSYKISMNQPTSMSSLGF